MNIWIAYLQILVLNQEKNKQDMCDIPSALRHATDISRVRVLGPLHQFGKEETIRQWFKLPCSSEADLLDCSVG